MCVQDGIGCHAIYWKRFCGHDDEPRGSAVTCPFLSITKIKVNLVGCTWYIVCSLYSHTIRLVLLDVT